MPDPLSPLGSPGQPQPLASAVLAPSPPPASLASEPSDKANSAQTPPAEAARLDESLVRRVGRESTPKAPPSLEEAVREFRQYLENLPADLQYSKDEATGTVVFKVVNPITKEVIRQYPPEEVLQVARRLRQISKGSDASGILLDRKL